MADDNMEFKPININTALLSLVLAIAGWTLAKVVTLGESIAIGAERDIAMSVAFTDLRSRVLSVEVRLQANQIELARLMNSNSQVK